MFASFRGRQRPHSLERQNGAGSPSRHGIELRTMPPPASMPRSSSLPPRSNTPRASFPASATLGSDRSTQLSRRRTSSPAVGVTEDVRPRGRTFERRLQGASPAPSPVHGAGSRVRTGSTGPASRSGNALLGSPARPSVAVTARRQTHGPPGSASSANSPRLSTPRLPAVRQARQTMEYRQPVPRIPTGEELDRLQSIRAGLGIMMAVSGLCTGVWACVYCVNNGGECPHA